MRLTALKCMCRSITLINRHGYIYRNKYLFLRAFATSNYQDESKIKKTEAKRKSPQTKVEKKGLISRLLSVGWNFWHHQTKTMEEKKIEVSDHYQQVCLENGITEDESITKYSTVELIQKLAKKIRRGDSFHKAVGVDHKEVVSEMFKILLELAETVRVEDDQSGTADVANTRSAFKQLTDNAAGKNGLSDTDVLKLIKLKFIFENFPTPLGAVLHDRFVKNIPMRKYTVEQVLSVVESLSYYKITEESSIDILQSLLNDISLRTAEIKPEHLIPVFDLFPTNMFHIFWPVVNEQLQNLNFYQVFMVGKLVNKENPNEPLPEFVTSWIQNPVNLASISDFETGQLLENFISSHYYSSLCLEVLVDVFDKSKTSSAWEIDPEPLTCLLYYCTVMGVYRSELYKAGCLNFVYNATTYTSQQMYRLLKAIGNMNYIPPRTSDVQRNFFLSVEQHLVKNFYMIDVTMLLEMLVNLVFLGRVAVNFEPYIFAPLFQGLVQEMGENERKKCSRFIRILETAFTLRGFEPVLAMEYDWSELTDKYTHDGKAKVLHESIKAALQGLVGSSYVVEFLPRPTLLDMFYSIELGESLPEMDSINNVSKESLQTSSYKLALLVLDENSYAADPEEHMLGHEAGNIFLLKESGYTVVKVNKRDLLENEENLVEYLEGHILNTAGGIDASATENIHSDREIGNYT